MNRNQSDNLPVAEIIECNVMGQQTIKEIEGRLKFLRIGDKLYTQPSQVAQPEQTVEPVAWQWLDTGTFRKTLPKTAVVADWNPLFKNFPPVAQPKEKP